MVSYAWCNFTNDHHYRPTGQVDKRRKSQSSTRPECYSYSQDKSRVMPVCKISAQGNYLQPAT